RRSLHLQAFRGRSVPTTPTPAGVGLAGGAPGARGRNLVERADGRVEELGHIGKAEMGAGDVFVIETPGGGGYGDAAGMPFSKTPI
ncbi:hydantoinase B/oxoprolinase family protein, partial [Telluria sp. Tellsp104]